MLYNYSKLIGRIIEKFCTQAEFAKAMGLSERSIYLAELEAIRTVKSNGKIDYTCIVYEAEKNASFHRYVCIYSDWKRRIKGGAADD